MAQEEKAKTAAHNGSASGARSLYHDHFRFQYLNAAFNLGLFTCLARDPGATRKDIAQQLGLEEQPTRVLLLGCCAYGLVRKEADCYYNTVLTEPLTTTAEQIPAAFIPFQNAITYRPMSWFRESLQENTNIGLQRELYGSASTLYGRLSENPGLETTFHNMMGALSLIIAEELEKNLDLSGYTHLLDVGGGTAINATRLARRWPHLAVTIIDLPTVAGSATSYIEEQGLADRVRAIGIDAFHDEFPQGCDCVLFAHFLELWSPERIHTLLAKAARAVGPGSGVFVVSAAQNDDDTGPERAAWLSAYFLTVASGEGMVYSPSEHEMWFREAGFEPSGRMYLDNVGDVAVAGVKS